MIISMAALKGGVAKTTSAVHLAEYLQTKGSTLLVDADGNQTALKWAAQEKLTFKTVSLDAFPKYAGKYKHTIIDTQARPSANQLADISEGCDLLILPSSPNFADVDAVLETGAILSNAQARFKVLFTLVEPGRRGKPNAELVNAQEVLGEEGIPFFRAFIPRLRCVARSVQEGVTVRIYPDLLAKKAWRAYQALGREVLDD